MADKETILILIDELIKEAQEAPQWKAESALRCLKKELLKEQEPVVHCKDCVKRDYDNCPFNEFSMYTPEDNFYCGEGAMKWNDT